ncbi:hypothetical protein DFH06DRAFT_1297766 [Mycena polygramma]|nr:hypothetical protein DFH06DRAFT_1297766 [Mycena polygramma]
MVLTRRASKCIIRWLPNEVLTEVVQYLMPLNSDSESYEDLLALCRTSRLLQGLTTPVLYRDLRLYTIFDIHACFSTLRAHATSQRAQFVRRLVMGDLDGDADIELSADLIRELAPVWHGLCHLQHLELSVVGPLSSLLQESHFPELTELKSTVPASFSEALRSFINRHSTLTSLDLVRGGTNTVIPNFGTISLPHLKRYTALGCFVSNLVVANKTLQTLVIFMDHEWRADDPRLAHKFAVLGDCIAPVAPTAGPQPCLTLCYTSSSLLEHDLLRYIAQGMSHIPVVKILTPYIHLSEESAQTIASTLTRFSGLRTLDWISFLKDRRDIQEMQDDRPIIESWGRASPSLASIELYGGLWKRVANKWVFTSTIVRNL